MNRFMVLYQMKGCSARYTSDTFEDVKSRLDFAQKSDKFIKGEIRQDGKTILEVGTGKEARMPLPVVSTPVIESEHVRGPYVPTSAQVEKLFADVRALTERVNELEGKLVKRVRKSKKAK